MPLRQDPSLWWNLPGIVAAYQPVRAPDSLLARYNMAYGGDNRNRASASMGWSALRGWIGNGSNTIGLPDALKLAGAFSIITTLKNVASWNGLLGIYGGRIFTGLSVGGIGFGYYSTVGVIEACIAGNGTRQVAALTIPLASMPSSAVIAHTWDGITTGTGMHRFWFNDTPSPVANTAAGNYPIWDAPFVLGNANRVPITADFLDFSIYNRILTPAEVWQASRQMAYCDVNPDWSVWSPRRKWFPYVLEAPVAGRVGVCGARPTIALPGGVRIVPQSEGGTNG